jgi:flagellar motor protein MotB
MAVFAPRTQIGIDGIPRFSAPKPNDTEDGRAKNRRVELVKL